MAIAAGILKDRPENLFRIKVFDHILDNSDPQRLGSGPDHGNGLRVAEPIHKERLCLGFGGAFGHGHGLGCRSCFIQQAGIGHGQPG